MFMQSLSPQEIIRIRWTLAAFFMAWACLFMMPAWLAQQRLISPLGVLLHINSTRLCVVLDALIFVLAWNAFGNGRLFGNVTMALTFLCTASLDFLYLSCLPGMPFLLPHPDPDTAMFFWWPARLASAAGVTLVLCAPVRLVLPTWLARTALLLAFALVGAYALLVLRHWPMLPALPDLEGSARRLPGILRLVTLALALSGALLAIFAMTRKRTGHATMGAPIASDIMLACIALAIAELPQSGLPGLASPVFRLVATVYFFRAILGGSIRAPFATMAQLTHRLQAASSALRRSELRLAGIIDNALDAIITIDDGNRIVLANPAAAAMFETTPEAMRGSPIEAYIPARHHRGFQGYIRNFNKVRISFFKTGSSGDEYDVSGLRANGSEFPMEASISVMVEGETRFSILILRDISERKKAQEELSRSHAELRRLSAALQSGRETERKHVARDLHDDLGQLLAALRIDLSLLQQQAQQASSVEPTQLDNMDALLSTSIRSLRRIASDLRPRALDEGGLYFALQSLRKDFEARHGIACSLQAEEDELVLDEERTTTLYRIVQEALANVVRHAAARNVNIRFSRHAGELALRIDDDGRGIGTDDFLNPAGFGLVDMRERVKGLHGQLCIAGEPGRGTCVDITIPVPPLASGHAERTPASAIPD